MVRYLTSLIHTFFADEEGASAIEYGLIIGLIAVALIVVLGLLGTDLSALFTDVQEQIPTGTE